LGLYNGREIDFTLVREGKGDGLVHDGFLISWYMCKRILDP
jgi:hypothetical protein